MGATRAGQPRGVGLADVAGRAQQGPGPLPARPRRPPGLTSGKSGIQLREDHDVPAVPFRHRGGCGRCSTVGRGRATGGQAVGLRIVVADDHTVARVGTRQILERHLDLRVVAEAQDGAAAVEAARQLHPDVAILDVRLPGSNGIAAAAEIGRLCPPTRVLMFTAYDDDDYVTASLEAGALGYVLKTATAAFLVDAVRAVGRGESVLDPAIARRMSALWRRRRTDGNALTARELEVLRRLTTGASNKRIADDLSISVRTVETHLKRIFAKLGAASRTEAALFAVQRGIVPVAGAPSWPPRDEHS
jgi:DNA-binding NarL/FixJ family response regulator